jgi:FkbM family methyltransferase
LVEVAGGDLRGAKLHLDLKTEKDYWLGTYETDLQAALRRWVKVGWTAYDLGANIGYITLLLARQVGSSGQVIAVEALPANLARLRTNLNLNDLEQQVQVLAGAISDRSGVVDFLVGPSGGTGKMIGSAGRDLEYSQSLAVNSFTLDELVYQQDYPLPEVIKMDIEGGEVLALAGMRQLLIEAKPLVLIELHGKQAGQAAWEQLTTAGYVLYRMEAGFPVVNSLEELDWKAYVIAAQRAESAGVPNG